ncbi:UNVERIFIED_CONTAM: hypothetical protein HDU68_002597 [Siphonaria sp. JEL0065]|nr:hypothetical protein HDU68_002597 [Siphonaria sp. JEL0065]
MILAYIVASTLAASTFATPVKPFLGVYWKDGQNPNFANKAAVAAGSNTLSYGGGPLLSNIVVKPLYWSNNVLFNYDAFYSASVTGTNSSPSNFMSILTEYSIGSYTLGAGSSSAGITNTAGATSGTVTVSAVENYIISLVNSGALDPSGGSLYVPVHFASGITIQEDKNLQLGNSCIQWCAFHYSVNTSRGWVYYGIHPEMSSGNCAKGCGTGTPFANNCAVASHELAEAATDADQKQTGWLNNPNGEIGDICNGQQGTFCGADGYQYSIQKQWSNKKNACVAPSTSGQSCPNGVATGGKPGPVTTTTTTTIAKPATTTTTTTTSTSSSGGAGSPCTTVNAQQCVNGDTLLCYYWIGSTLTWASWGGPCSGGQTTTTTTTKAGATSTTTTTTVGKPTTTTAGSTTTGSSGGVQGSPCTGFGAVQCISNVQYQCVYGASSSLTWSQWGYC